MKNLLTALTFLFAASYSNLAMATDVVVAIAQANESLVGRTMAVFKEKAEEFSHGKLLVRIYPSGQLGTFGATVTQMQTGLVNLIFTQPDALGQQVPIATANSWPFLFSNQDEMLAAWRGPGGQKLIGEIEKVSGYRVLSPTWNAPRWIITTRDAKSLADLRGAKIRVPGTSIYIEQMKLLGLSPVPMNIVEVFTGMQQGIVEGMEADLAGAAGYSLQDVAKSVIMSSHVLSPKVFLTWGKWLDGLSDEERAAFNKALDEAAAYYGSQLEKESSQDRSVFEAKGVTFADTGLSQSELRDMVEPMKQTLPEIWQWAKVLSGQ